MAVDPPSPARSAGAPGSEAEALGLGPKLRPWLEALAAAPAGTGRPVPGTEEEDLLAWLGVDPGARAEVLATRDEVAASDAYSWLIERCQAEIAACAGDPEGPRLVLLPLPDHLGGAGRCFPIHLYLAALPDALERHRLVGVLEQMSRATFGDLARHVAIRRRADGRTGLDAPWWSLLALCGVIFECGRLQYGLCRLGSGSLGPGQWYDEEEAEALGEGSRRGDVALDVHVPEGPGLTPDACDASDALARDLLASSFADFGIRVATCTSWLLDEQLAGYLPEGSNIVGFQRRFELLPGGRLGDADPLRFVFGLDAVPEPSRLERLTQVTTLERAVAVASAGQLLFGHRDQRRSHPVPSEVGARHDLPLDHLAVRSRVPGHETDVLVEQEGAGGGQGEPAGGEARGQRVVGDLGRAAGRQPENRFGPARHQPGDGFGGERPTGRGSRLAYERGIVLDK